MGKRKQPTKAVKKQKTDWTESLLEVWIGLFVAFYLLFPGFRGYRGISAAKTWSFYILMLLLLAVGVWHFVRDLRRGALRPLRLSQMAALAFWAFTLFSAVFSQTEKGNALLDGTAHEAALTLSLYVLLFLVVSRWGVPTERLFRVLFWTVAVFCALCLLQALGGNPFGLYPGNLNYYDGYNVKYSGGFAGTIGNVDFVSVFLALVTPMLALHSLGQRPKQAWPCWLLAAACLAIAVWIHVLCGLMGLALGGVICMVVLCPARRRKWVLLVLGALALCGVVVLRNCDLPVSFLHELHEILNGRILDSYGTGRFYIWRQMLERVPDRLLFGVGPDMARYSGLAPFIRMTPKTVEVSLSGYETSVWLLLPGFKTAQVTDAHCYPLHILYCQGLPALLSWLSLVGLTLIHWVKARADRAVRLLGGGLVCFLCAMLFCPSSIIVMPFAWLSMALIEAKAGDRDA